MPPGVPCTGLQSAAGHGTIGRSGDAGCRGTAACDAGMVPVGGGFWEGTDADA